MKTWEYRTETIDTRGQCLIWNNETRQWEWLDMNVLGADGWELVAVFVSEGDEATAVFKREKAQTNV